MKLFKLLSVSALLFGAVTVASAQESNAESMKVSYGIKGGVNFATLNGAAPVSPDSRTNFNAGVFVELPVAQIFSVQVEALYSGQGAELYSDNVKSKLALDYINVPVLAKFYIVKGLSIEAGPQFSFLLNDEVTVEGNTSPSPYRGNLKTFEFGVSGGLTFQTSSGVFAQARYNQGITDVIDGLNAQNSVFQLGIGYKF